MMLKNARCLLKIAGFSAAVMFSPTVASAEEAPKPQKTAVPDEDPNALPLKPVPPKPKAMKGKAASKPVEIKPVVTGVFEAGEIYPDTGDLKAAKERERAQREVAAAQAQAREAGRWWFFLNPKAVAGGVSSSSFKWIIGGALEFGIKAPWQRRLWALSLEPSYRHLWGEGIGGRKTYAHAFSLPLFLSLNIEIKTAASAAGVFRVMAGPSFHSLEAENISPGLVTNESSRALGVDGGLGFVFAMPRGGLTIEARASYIPYLLRRTMTGSVSFIAGIGYLFNIEASK